ncbi:hypothetical protein [Nocardioides pacificus]
MSVYTNRVGQVIGSLEVVADHKRTKDGKVVWRCIDRRDGSDRFYRTEKIIRLDRLHQAREGSSGEA